MIKESRDLAQLLQDIDRVQQGVPADTGYTRDNSRLKDLPPNKVYVRLRGAGVPVLAYHNGIVDPQKPNVAVYVKPVSNTLDSTSNNTRWNVVALNNTENELRFGGLAVDLGTTSPELIKVNKRRLSEARVSVDPNNKWGLFISGYQSQFGTVPPMRYAFSSGIINTIESTTNMVWFSVVSLNFSNINVPQTPVVAKVETPVNLTNTQGINYNVADVMKDLHVTSSYEPTTQKMILCAVTLRNGKDGIQPEDIIDLRETFNTYRAALYDSVRSVSGFSGGYIGTLFNGTGQRRTFRRVSVYCRTPPNTDMPITVAVNGGGNVVSNYVHPAGSNASCLPSTAGYDDPVTGTLSNAEWRPAQAIDINIPAHYNAQDIIVTIEYW